MEENHPTLAILSDNSLLHSFSLFVVTFYTISKNKVVGVLFRNFQTTSGGYLGSAASRIFIFFSPLNKFFITYFFLHCRTLKIYLRTFFPSLFDSFFIAPHFIYSFAADGERPCTFQYSVERLEHRSTSGIAMINDAVNVRIKVSKKAIVRNVLISWFIDLYICLSELIIEHFCWPQLVTPQRFIHIFLCDSKDRK